MRKFAMLAAGSLAAVVANPATAQITDDTTINHWTLDFGPTPTQLADHVTGNGAPSGTTLTLISDSGHLIDFTAPTTLEQEGGSGFATVSGEGNGGSEQGFATLTIDAQEPWNFTAMNFALTALGKGNTTYYGDITLNLLLGGSVTFTNVALSTAGETHFGISSDNGGIFSSIVFSNLGSLDGNTSANFASIKQDSVILTTAVPEPATWAMMLLGFGAAGVAMRRTRRRQQVLTQIA